MVTIPESLVRAINSYLYWSKWPSESLQLIREGSRPPSGKEREKLRVLQAYSDAFQAVKAEAARANLAMKAPGESSLIYLARVTGDGTSDWVARISVLLVPLTHSELPDRYGYDDDEPVWGRDWHGEGWVGEGT